MADVWGALAQALPAAATLTAVYTCPAAKHSTVEVIICNRAGAANIRLSLAPLGAADASTQYLMYDFALAANDAVTTARLTVSATDVIRAYSSTGSVAFTVNGIEEDA